MVIIIVIIVLIIGISIFLINESSKEEKLDEYFTAKEGKGNADKKAKEWKDDAILLVVWAHGDYENNNGKSDKWEYDYYSPSTKEVDEDGDETYLKFGFVLSSEATSEGQTYRGGLHDYPFDNWQIDSDEAYSIVMNNEDVKDFYTKYPDPEFGMFRLNAYEYLYDNHPVWSFTWNGEPGNILTHLEVTLDATTGEILYVHKYYE